MLLTDRGAGISIPIAAADEIWWLYGCWYGRFGQTWAGIQVLSHKNKSCYQRIFSAREFAALTLEHEAKISLHFQITSAAQKLSIIVQTLWLWRMREGGAYPGHNLFYPLWQCISVGKNRPLNLCVAFTIGSAQTATSQMAEAKRGEPRPNW